jgi:outer membrane protein insertion porin family
VKLASIPDKETLMKKASRVWSIMLPFIMVLPLIPFLMPTHIMALPEEKVAVLPFRLYMVSPEASLSLGLQEMLSARLADRGFEMVDPDLINASELAEITISDTDLAKSVAGGRGIDWIIGGSLTQIGKNISLDLRLIPAATDRSPISVFVQGNTIDEIAQVVQRAAEMAGNRIKGIDLIESISIKGNRRIEDDAILAVITSQEGTVYNPSMLDRDLKSIYQMGYFEDVQIDVGHGRRGTIVIFEVTEKPSISEVRFEGNKKVKEEDLREVLGIKKYSILNMKAIKESIERLKEHYNEKRYYHVEIHERIEELPNNEVALIYRIKEGKRAYIRRISFVGNRNFTDDELRDVMDTREKGFFSFFSHSGYLDTKKLESDVFKLTSFYHNHGYIKAKIGEPEVSYTKQEGIQITLPIDEGPQYALRDITIEGDLIKDRDELFKELKIVNEKVYNREVIRADTLRLSEIYADEGYAFVDVFAKINEDDQERKVDIAYRISKGEKVRFERIEITGNTKTRDKVIRRELQAVEGGYFSGKRLKRSRQNLYLLGFFGGVEINTKKGSSDDQMILDVQVEERPTGMLSFGMGYSSTEKAMGMLQVSKTNLFGLGQTLAARAQFSSKAARYTLSFTEPWLFDKPLSAGIDLYNWEYEYDEYTKHSTGGKLRFGFPLGIDFTRGTLAYTYDNAKISDVAETASLIVKDIEGENLTSSMTFGINRDSRDQRFNARSGSVNGLSVEYAGGILAGDNYFTKYQGRSAWFFPLFEHSSFSVQGRWGYIERRPGGKLPIYEKFMVGGMNTVRGFEHASISPVDPISGDKIGGEKMMVYNAELRFPLQQEQGVVGVLFFDAGNVFGKDDPITFEGIRRSAGAGIRWYSPAGPLRLEWGYNLDQRADEPSSNWEFTMGTPF